MSRTTFRPRIEALEDRLALSGSPLPTSWTQVPNPTTSTHPAPLSQTAITSVPSTEYPSLIASLSGVYTPVEFLPYGTMGTHTTPPAQHTGHGQSSTQSPGYTPTLNPMWDQPPARMM